MSKLGDFIERHAWAQFIIVAAVTFAIAFVVTWFPYGFVAGDLTIDPFAWHPAQRAVLLLIWFGLLALIGLSAAS